MDRERHNRRFDLIAPVYSWFFSYQVGQFQHLIAENPDALPATRSRILDIGCGTGALAFVLTELDHEVTGLDASRRMIEIARRLNRGNTAVFVQGDALDWPDLAPGTAVESRTAHGIPVPASGAAGVTAAWAGVAGSFDVVIASYVLHGLKKPQRRQLYQVMKQLASRRIIIMDYNENRNPWINLIEWFEGSDYFQFIYNVMTELREFFPLVKVVQTGPHGAWYICDCLDTV